MYKSITATRLLFALAFLVLSLGLIGQPKNSRIGDVAMAAPNAAALGKYGDIPVSYYTGVPNISIPLYNLQHGPLSLPLSLSYHASGVKVGELASWVGMGWSLQAGGLISRSVLGLPDETSTWGYYNSAAELDIKKPLVLGEVAVGQRDGEPDLFSINAGNLNAKFYINQDKAPVFIERTDLKIEVYFNYSKFEGFLITDTEGTRYYFGKIPGESVAWEETSYSSSSTRFISSWYLLRIESQDKNYQINFSYKAESYSYRSLSSCEKAITMCDYLGAPQNGGNTTSGTSQSCAGSAVNSRGTYYTRVDIVGLRLSSITAGNTIVTFSANTAREDTDAYYLTSNKSYRLDNVDISSGAGKYCTRYEFSYSYFKDNAVSASEAKRLKLTQLQKRECGTTSPTELPTKFTYNGTVTSGQQFLPERLSKAVDHWGFYNGAGGNNSTQLNIPTSSGIAPNGTNNTYSSTVNRETDEVAMRLGTLERIDYPTGGSTQFSFEANTVNDQVNSSSVSTLGSVLKTSDSSLGAANCGRLSPSKTMNYTFPSGTSAQATYSFTVNSVYFTDGSKCPNAQIEYAKILVYTKVNGIDKVIGEKSFNLDPLHRYKSENLPVSALNLKDGAAYRFVLQSENAWGQFKLTGPTSITTTNVIAKVGGLRVKQIISADGISSSNNITKTYEYKSAADPAKTSGVLYNKPKYVYQMQGLGVAIDNGYAAENSIAALVYTDQSVVPLYSFAGYHIGYTKVREIFTDNGYVDYEFLIGAGTSTNSSYRSYPVTPLQLNVYAGQSKSTSTYKQGGTKIASVSNTAITSGGTSSKGTIVLTGRVFNCVGTAYGSGTSYAFMYNTYTIPGGASYRIGSKTEVVDGVTTVTSYTYDTNNRFLAPASITTTNSDNKQTKVTNVYAFDLGSSAIRTEMLNRNLIATPVETKVEVGGTRVGGSKTEFALFSRTTGLPVSSATGADVYPYKFYDYEMTWNGTTATTGAHVLKGTVNRYHLSKNSGKGYPNEYTATNWPTETYDWANGLITKRTYEDYVWSYLYEDKSRLLSSITDVDKQITKFTYDKLERLKTVSARSAAVVTTYDYHHTASTVAADKNYVKSSTTYTAVSGSSLTNRTSWQYLDGLGRPIQSVEQKHSPGGKDVVTAIQYDKVGRTVRTYNPFEATTTTGVFTTIPSTAKYTLTAYETSPLGRVASVTPPDWYGTTTTYGANAASEVLLNGSTSVYYAANLLSKVTTTDPAGNKSITYTDKKGRVVLSRRAGTSSSDVANTYSLYDNRDRVKMVIPPGATVSTTGLTFQYTYDGANNLLTKKVPDADLVTYRYNTRDQPVLMQDGNLLADSKKWIASVYDDYGRVTKTGYWSGTIPTTISPTSLTIASANELTKAYYDGYDGSNQTSLTTAPQYRGKVRKSLVRVLDGSSTATWLATTNSYDAHGRLTQTSGNNYQNASNASSEVMTMTYDWADNPLAQIRVHKPSSSVTRTLAYRNTYDAAGRRSGYYLKVDSGAEQLLAGYNYDERDLLRTRNLHGKPVTITSTPRSPLSTPALSTEVGSTELAAITLGTASRAMSYLQSLDYTYNAQGWLTGINQLAASGTSTGIKVAPTAAALPNPGDPARTYGANDLFGLELRYDQLLSGVSGTARKDGNITQVIWRTRGRERQAYSATYDYLSRMSVASYYDITDGGTVSSDQKFKEEVTYADARGNIKTLKRNGMYPSGAAWAVGQIDNLTYGYTTSGTNKLATVTEAASTSAAKPFGFNPGAGGTGYGYDKNGNLIKDTYKGITAITYNYLNLPTKISFGSSKSITFTYDATGRKLKKVTAGGASAENYTQYYADGLEYKSTTLEAIYHEEGRLTPKTSTTWQYEYSIRDHLGNTRMTFADKNGDGKISVTNSASTNEVLQENHYTPFGLELGYAWLNDAAADSKYTYNSKEFNADFGLKLLDYGARWYNPAVARWTSVDPLADSYTSVTPYAYVANDPVSFIDPDGMRIDVSEFFQQKDDDEERNNSNTRNLVGLMASISDITGHAVRINDSKELQLGPQSAHTKGSKLATNFLQNIIDDDRVVKVVNATKSDVNKKGATMVPIGTNTIEMNFPTLNIYQKEANAVGLEPINGSSGMFFFHELVHTIVGSSYAGGSREEFDHSQDGSSSFAPGRTVAFINKIRKELGVRQRINYFHDNARPYHYYSKYGTVNRNFDRVEVFLSQSTY